MNINDQSIDNRDEKLHTYYNIMKKEQTNLGRYLYYRRHVFKEAEICAHIYTYLGYYRVINSFRRICTIYL